MSDFKKFFDKHHKMERLGAALLVFCITLSSMLAYGYKTKFTEEKHELGSQALYTEEVSWSLSDAKVKIKNVYTNKDNTSILITMKQGDMESTTTDANAYRFFILPDKGTMVEDNISGAYYVFGGTGYSALKLINSNGFSPSYMRIVARNVRTMTSKDEGILDGHNDADTFKMYNQIEFFVNPAGQDAVYATCLDNPDASVSDIYAECVIVDEVQEIKDKLTEDLVQINEGLSHVHEYKRRLENSGFKVELPGCIANDRIVKDVTLTEQNPISFSEDMLVDSNIIQSDYTNMFQSDGINNEDGYVIGDKIYMQTDFVFPGGCQYNYQDVNIVEKYTNKITPPGMSYQSWKQTLFNQSELYKEYKWFTADTTGWILNGAEYIYRDDVNAQSVEAIYNKDINAYNKALSDVVAQKINYQTVDAFKLLDIDNGAQSIGSVVTINNNPENIMKITLGQ